MLKLNSSLLKNHWLWLGISLIFSLFYAGITLEKAFSSQYVVQDDARVYVFWMQRFLEPDLLPQDLIANYFQSVTPIGYAGMYHLLAIGGINPLFFSKILPTVLGVITTVYCYYLSLELFPVPVTAFLSSLLFNQSLWLRDDLISATPRAFISPLLLAFLYYLSRHDNKSLIFTIILMGLFYPLGVLLQLAVLIIRLTRTALLSWKQKPAIDSQFYQQNQAIIIGLLIGVAVLIFYNFNQSEYGPTVSAGVARNWPEFLPTGRIPFFDDENPLKFWFSGQHSGIRLSLNPPILITAFILPYFILIKQYSSSKISLLLELLFASLGCFFLSHLLLFKLYLPSRYTIHTLPMILSLAAAISLTLVAETLINLSFLKLKTTPKFILNCCLICLTCGIIFYPHLFWQKAFPKNNYVIGNLPALYEFLQKQPSNTLVASLSSEINNLPTFGKQAIFTGLEYANPYHVGYYNIIRQRYQDLISAQYSQNPQQIIDFINKYQIKYWLLDSFAFTAKEIDNKFLKQYQPAQQQAYQTIQQNQITLLSKTPPNCTAWHQEDYRLLETQCLIKYLSSLSRIPEGL